MKRRGTTVHHRARVLRYDPRRRLALRLLLALAIAAAIAGAWWYGQAQGAATAAGALDTNAALRAQLEEAVRARTELEQQVATLGKGTEIDKGAAAQLRADFATARATIARLEQEVSVYQSLLDASVRTRGLALQRFELRRGADGACCRYALTLMQRAQRPAQLGGTLSLSVAGQQAGKARTLALAELGAGKDALPLAFRYFQVFEGQLALPAGFVPQQVRIQARTTGRNPQRLEQTLPWKIVEEE